MSEKNTTFILPTFQNLNFQISKFGASANVSGAPGDDAPPAQRHLHRGPTGGTPGTGQRHCGAEGRAEGGEAEGQPRDGQQHMPGGPGHGAAHHPSAGLGGHRLRGGGVDGGDRVSGLRRARSQKSPFPGCAVQQRKAKQTGGNCVNEQPVETVQLGQLIQFSCKSFFLLQDFAVLLGFAAEGVGSHFMGTNAN